MLIIIVSRVAVLTLFILCVYAGNVLFLKIQKGSQRFIWRFLFVTFYSLFLLMISYLVWFVLLFGVNA